MDEEKRLWASHHFGYPAFASWMASSRDFFLLRRFSASAARSLLYLSLLYLQHQIATVEQSLSSLDDESKKRPMGEAGIDRIDGDPFADRAALVEKLTNLLQRYCAVPRPV